MMASKFWSLWLVLLVVASAVADNRYDYKVLGEPPPVIVKRPLPPVAELPKPAVKQVVPAAPRPAYKPAPRRAYKPAPGMHSHVCTACRHEFWHYPGGSHVCPKCGNHSRGNYRQHRQSSTTKKPAGDRSYQRAA